MKGVSSVSANTVVAATDLSEASAKAVEQAALLAKQWNAELTLLHVFNEEGWKALMALFEDESSVGSDPYVKAKGVLLRLAEEIEARHGVATKGEIRIGAVAAEIAAYCRGANPRLLVVGEHADDWIGDSLVGGTVVRLLKLVDIPVFLARGPEKASFSEILVGTDFSESAKRAAMLSMSWFPKASHKIVHAYHVAFEGFLRMSGATEDRIESLRQEAFSIAKQQMQEQLRSLDPEEQIDGVMLHGYPAIALLREIDHSGVELAVIGSYCGSTLEDRPLGSVTRNLLYHARSNVLFVP